MAERYIIVCTDHSTCEEWQLGPSFHSTSQVREYLDQHITDWQGNNPAMEYTVWKLASRTPDEQEAMTDRLSHDGWQQVPLDEILSPPQEMVLRLTPEQLSPLLYAINSQLMRWDDQQSTLNSSSVDRLREVYDLLRRR